MKALLTLMLIALLTMSSTSQTDDDHVVSLNIIESVNTLEDMYEWITWDVAEGTVDPYIGATYQDAIDDVLERLYSEY